MKRESRGKRPQFYSDPAIDQIMSMVMVLAGEVSVLADEIDLMKRVFAARGIDLPAEMQNFVLDEAALEEREARRQRSLERLFYLVRKEAAEMTGGETSAHYNATLDKIAEQ